MNRISKILQPINVIPKNAVIKNQDMTSNSQKLMLELGLIRSAANGSYFILPLLQRSIEKLTTIIDENMRKVGAQKLSLPVLTSAELWKKTGRFTTANTELLTTKDRHDKLQILSPTHEESITSLMASLAPVSYRQFPMRLYQIGPKFRDELKPRFGLMRAKEFLMKDCYTFDIGRDEALLTYSEMNNIYATIFNQLGVDFVKVCGDSGTIGGSLSHEYHVAANIGEDTIVVCNNSVCGFATNKELGSSLECPNCGSKNLKESQGIEIGHTFLLEEKYSKPLGATFLQQSGKPAPLSMGCYGIGVSRLIAAALEVQSNEDELCWPIQLAPFTVCLITPKDGSKEAASANPWINEMYHSLNKEFPDAVIVDDRTTMTIGKRLMEAKRFGYPFVVVIGAKAAAIEPQFEVHEAVTGRVIDASIPEVLRSISVAITSQNIRQNGVSDALSAHLR